MPESTDARPKSERFLLWFFALLAVAGIAVAATLWLNQDDTQAVALENPCQEGHVLLPGNGCQPYDELAIYWTYTDFGEHYLKSDDPEPAMVHTLMEEYSIDVDRGITTGTKGVIGIEFENPCFPISQSIAEEGMMLILPSSDDPMVATEVAPEAQDFIRSMFTLGGMDVEMIELDFVFRVYFRQAIEKDQIDAYVTEVFNAMIDSGWCQSGEKGGSV